MLSGDMPALLLRIQVSCATNSCGTREYVEFWIGDYRYELRIIDRRFLQSWSDHVGGAIVHWHVDDVRAALERLVSLGGMCTRSWSSADPASVVDPFGNILGVMFNQHDVEVLRSLLPGTDGKAESGLCGGEALPVLHVP